MKFVKWILESLCDIHKTHFIVIYLRWEMSHWVKVSQSSDSTMIRSSFAGPLTLNTYKEFYKQRSMKFGN